MMQNHQNGEPVGSLLFFQKSNILINRCSAQITYSCQFRKFQLTALVCGIVPQDGDGNLIYRQLRSTDTRTFRLGNCHPGAKVPGFSFLSKCPLDDSRCIEGAFVFQ